MELINTDNMDYRVNIESIDQYAARLEEEGLNEFAMEWREFAREVRAENLKREYMGDGVATRLLDAPDGSSWFVK